MSKREKLIQAMRNNPKDIPFEKIQGLLCYYGCTERQRGGGSSHFVFSHPALDYSITIPKERPIKAFYVKDALKMIDDIKEKLEKE